MELPSSVSVVSIFTLLLISTVQWVAFATSPCHFPAIFNFGDSNSDTGGLSAVFGQAPPPHGESYFHHPAGRYCDGRLIIDFIGYLSNMDGNTTADNIVALDNVVIENSAVIISIVANFAAAAAIVSLAKPFLDISKIEFFGRENFRRWQERIFGVLDMHEVVWVLTDPKTNDNVEA